MTIPPHPLPPAKASRDRGWLIITVRALLALVLIGLVITRVNWKDYTASDEHGIMVTSPGVLSSLGAASAGWLTIAFLVSVCSLIVTALRWNLLLKAQDIHITIRETIKLQLIGEFFSTAIPGAISGDLIKAFCVMQSTAQKAHVIMSVFVDRLIGFCGMVFTALFMLLILIGTRLHDSSLIRLSAPSVAAVAAAAGITLWFLLSPGLRRISSLHKLHNRLPFWNHLERAAEAIRRYRTQPRILIRAATITIAAQTLNILFVMLTGMSIGLSLSWTHYFLHVPLIMIISAVPVTPGSIGLSEQLYLLYFAGVTEPGPALALAVLVRALTLTGALPGGVIAMSRGISKRKVREAILINPL